MTNLLPILIPYRCDRSIWEEGWNQYDNMHILQASGIPTFNTTGNANNNKYTKQSVAFTPTIVSGNVTGNPFLDTNYYKFIGPVVADPFK